MPSRDLLLGLVVVAAIAGADLFGGKFNVIAPTSVPVPPIAPIVTCVVGDPAHPGSYLASFGYVRADGTGVVRIPRADIGVVLNYVVVDDDGPPQFAPQVPTEFVAGFQRDQFVVRARETQRITWWLTSDQTRSAEATAHTKPVCTSVPELSR